jgi:Tannase and feruloyl esterase
MGRGHAVRAGPARGRGSRRGLCMSVAVALALLTPHASRAQSNGSSLTNAGLLARVLGTTRSGAALRCRDLRALGAAGLSIVSASESGAGQSALCRVHGVILAEVQFMLELPAAWNGRLYVLGNGGYGGEPVTSDYAAAERRRAAALGFATLFTDLGHDRRREPGAEWARGSLARKLDYGIRALHASTLAAKDLLGRYYGSAARYSYFDGCSTGGGQGLKATQRYPADYDGVLAGAPVFDWVQLQVYGWNNQMAILEQPLATAKVALLARRVLELFDAKDGVRDGVIEDPLSIDFDPARDLPRHGPPDESFTDAEIAALERIYRGTYLDGRQIAPGAPLGAEPWGQMYAGPEFEPAAPESGWATRLVPDAHGAMQQRGNVEGWLRYLAFETDEPQMDVTRFDLRRDLPRLQAMSELLDATDPDLTAFAARGGRLLIYHGWADTGVNPITTVRYYESVLRTMGDRADRSVRLYTVPGMFHCRGGLGVDRFDGAAAVIAWVERGEPPEPLLASRVEGGSVVRTRPLCAYPLTARYLGTGSSDDAGSFACKRPRP